MIIDRLIWLPAIVEKLYVKHGVSVEEVEEVFYRQPIVRFHEKGRIQDENLYAAFGQIDSGRYLTVFSF